MKFGNLPIRKKVSAVILLIMGLAIGLSFLGTFFLQSITFQQRAESELITLASIIGESVNSAIFFGDTAEAARVLEHLRAQRFKHLGEITEIHILSLPHRDIFASTPAGAAIPSDLFSKGIGIYSTTGGVWLIHELKDDKDRIFAHIMVRSSLRALQQEQRNLLLLLMAVFLMTLVVAYYLGRRMQLNLIFPISSLASTVQQIAEKGDHALRAQRFSNDEVGVLTDHVNHMLDTLDAQSLALQESEALFRSQFEYGNIGIAITSVEKGWLKANTCLCNMLGYTAEELKKKTWPEMTHPDDLAADLAQYERMLKGEIESYEMDKRFVRKDRSIIHTHLTVSCFRNADRSVKFVIASLLDITIRKQAETERELLINELELRNAELERFTYTVSHDLKSPLITMRGFLGYLEQDALAGNSERMKADIARITNATDKMEQLLRELLELSRIGRVMNPPEQVGFGEIAREAVGLVAGQLKERGVRVEIATGMPVVFGDHVRLVEVVQNLVDNAAKFMGGQPAPRIEIGAREEERDGKPVLFVKDNGIGIEPRYQEKIFGLFDKLDAKTEGTGIGLTIVKRIVEVHGGTIWIESEGSGQGATFCFTLPRPQAASGNGG